MKTTTTHLLPRGLFLAAVLLSMAETATPKTLSPTEKTIKAEFNYSFNDIAEKIVAISSTSGKERGAGSGFIARQDGKTYLFTNQHVMFGADRISFKTATGRALHPASVELSARRDIVRLLLPDSPEAFEITDSSSTGTPVAVFGNSEGGGVATEIYGKIIAEERDTIEVSALFVSGNSGSPVLDPQQNILGIATYVSYSHDDETGSKTRRFCYRVAGAQWKAVNWKKYNHKYGTQLRESERLFDTTAAAIDDWRQAAYSRIPPGIYDDTALRGWVNQHNNMVDIITELSDEDAVWPRRLNLVNTQIKEAQDRSAHILALLCRNRAAQMRVNAKQPGLTGCLKKRYLQLARQFEEIEQEAKKTGAELSSRDFFHFK